jgi:hypothetical protein
MAPSFLHDVGWPYGRRDMHYRPELIPPEFVHPYAAKAMVIGQSRLSDAGGCNAEFFNALDEGGSQERRPDSDRGLREGTRRCLPALRHRG